MGRGRNRRKESVRARKLNQLDHTLISKSILPFDEQQISTKIFKDIHASPGTNYS